MFDFNFAMFWKCEGQELLLAEVIILTYVF